MMEIKKLEEIQEIEFSILKYIKCICEEHSLRYFLAGGTLLGAIRHKGFIPWDNDIDISMPREDYKRFVKIIENSKHPYYKILKIEDKNDYVYPFVKLIDSRTKVIEHDKFCINDLGLYVDIFPMDGLGDDMRTAIKIVKKAHKISGLIGGTNLSRNGISIFAKIKIVCKRIVFAVIGREKSLKGLETWLSKKDFDKSKYIASTYGLRIEKEIICSECFHKFINVEFMMEKFRAPIGYDQYLRQMYGDYMVLPPKEDRIAPHDDEMYWKEGYEC